MAATRWVVSSAVLRLHSLMLRPHLHAAAYVNHKAWSNRTAANALLPRDRLQVRRASLDVGAGMHNATYQQVYQQAYQSVRVPPQQLYQASSLYSTSAVAGDASQTVGASQAAAADQVHREPCWDAVDAMSSIESDYTMCADSPCCVAPDPPSVRKLTHSLQTKPCSAAVRFSPLAR